MTKKQEIETPTSCLNKGTDDTLKFVLTETDVAAGDTIRDWCRRRVRLGKNGWCDEQISEALNIADEIDKRNGSLTIPYLRV